MPQKPYEPAKGERRIMPRRQQHDVSIRVHLSHDARWLISGVAKSRDMTVQEATAEAFNDWLEKHGQPRLA